MDGKAQSLNDMRGPFAECLAEELWGLLVPKVIGALRDLPEGSRQSGDDSGLRDCWEEYKYQAQRQHSLFFEIYEELLLQFCEREVAGLGREQKGLLWLWGTGFILWNGDEEGAQLPFGVVMDGDLADELMRRVGSAASDEELAFDPDDYREKAPDAPADDEEEPAPEGRPENHADSPKTVELDWMPFTSSDIESMEARAGRHFFRFGEKVLWRVQGRTFAATVGGPAHCGFVVCLDPGEDARRMHLRGARLPSRDLPNGLWYASESELEPVKE